MVQGLFGGGTSYEGQSISDIKEDVNNWKIYTENVKSQIVEKKEALFRLGHTLKKACGKRYTP